MPLGSQVLKAQLAAVRGLPQRLRRSGAASFFRSCLHRVREILGRHPHVARFVAVVRSTISEVFDDRLFRLAAEAAFWALLSLAPLLLGLLGLVGYIGPWFGHHAVVRIQNDVLRLAGDVFTRHSVNTVVRPLVSQVLGRGHPDVASVGFLLSFWSGSAAMNAYVDAITIAYDLEGLRPAWRTRTLAVGLYAVAIVVGAVLLPILALGPTVLASLAPSAVSNEVSTLVHILYWPVVGAGCLAVLATLFRLAVPVKNPWHRGLPGAVLTMAAWLAGSLGIRAYLTSGLRNNSTYGSLAAPVAALLFFYVTALAVLIGAELNAVLDDMAAKPVTTEGRRRAARGCSR